MTTRISSAEWRGDLKGGSGEVEVGDGVFRGSYTFASRFEEGDGTNPEELAAAAHASCFSMFLANVLDQAGHAPETVTTEAAMTLDRVDGKPRITRVELTTHVSAEGLDAGALNEHAETAKVGCPISNLFTGAEITVAAKLAG